MWEADFGAIDGAIAGCFDYGEEICVMRIEHYLADRILHRGGSAQMLGFWGWTETDLDDIKIRHGAEFYLGKPVGRRKGRAEALKSTERLPANPHEDVEGVGFATGKGKGKMSSEDVERRCRAQMSSEESAGAMLFMDGTCCSARAATRPGTSPLVPVPLTCDSQSRSPTTFYR